MTRYSLTLTLTAGLLVFGVNTRAQNREKPAAQPVANQSADGPFAAFQQFSATLNGGLGRDTNRKIYRSGKLMRFDFPDHYRVSDLDTRSSWLVYPKSCSKVPMLDPGVFPFSRKFRVEQSSTIEGKETKETVDGHTCKIEDVVLVAEGPIPTTFKMKLYRAEDLIGFPLRIDVGNPMNHAEFTINYSNVSLEPPDAQLFKLPAKCPEWSLGGAKSGKGSRL